MPERAKVGFGAPKCLACLPPLYEIAGYRKPSFDRNIFVVVSDSGGLARVGKVMPFSRGCPSPRHIAPR